jgi:uncharacterized protein
MTQAAPVPVPPPLRPPAHGLDPRAVRWWQLRSLVGTVAVAAPQTVAWALTGLPVLGATLAVTAALGLAHLLLVPPLRYRIHRWETTDEAVYTLAGWLVREWRIAPISRVQTVDTQRGPLQQLLKLASVTVTTASARGPVTIAGLDAQVAAELARTLTATTQATPGDAT